MPATAVHYYCELDGRAPVREWLKQLRRSDPRAFAKCAAKLQRLAASGHELCRPDADLLRDGIYELRASSGRVNYRILYFFFGRNVAILAHAITKEDRVPPVEIERAMRRRALLTAHPDRHIAPEEVDDGKEEA